MAYQTKESLALARALAARNLQAWRSEVARRLARRIAAEEAAKTAPVIARLYPQRPGLPH